MNKEKLAKAKEIDNYLNIVNGYLDRFNPKHNVVWLHITDNYGNGSITLDLYAHDRSPKDNNSRAIGFTYDNFTKHYKEFLQKCTADLLVRKEELEKEFSKL